MQAPSPDQNISELDANVTSRIGYLRVAIGLAQGAVLYWLYRAAQGSITWPASAPLVFAPLLVLGTLLPLLLISSIGHMRQRALLQWVACAALILSVLALHDVWRLAPLAAAAQKEARWPTPLLGVFSTILLFIAHALVLGATQQQRRIASYAIYFETSWKLFIQGAFSALFVGALWVALTLGARLFMLVKIGFLEELIKHAWFNIPVTSFAFAWAMHITDVRPAMVRGIRTLLLVLMSWVMPIATLIVGGFLLSLPFTGLTVLWNTGSATTVLLLADALLILLINAAYQNGEVGESIATLVRLSARAAATLLVPLTAIAVYALSLRVGEHGWTSDRVIAATCLLVACCYALGYFAAACQRAGWLPLVAKVNVTAAFLVVAVLLALFSPIADPARISVNSQLARLDQGLVKAADFDYAYLRFQGGRYGNTALLGLKDRREGPDAALISERAKLALDQVYFGQGAILVDTDITANLKVWPATARLPATFPLRGWHSGRTALLMPKCLTQRNTSCDAFVIDLNSDGHNEVLLLATAPSEGNAVLSADAKGNWDVLGRLRFDLSKCEAFINSLKAGQFQLVAPHAKDIEIAGQRFGIDLNDQSQPGQCQELERALGGSGAGEGAANALTKTH